MPNLPTTNWRVAEEDNPAARQLASELNLNPLIARVLSARKIKDPTQARLFLSPNLKDLHNPFLMKDMKTGVERLLSALNRREKIIIYGDYDADGITSVAILYDFLRAITDRVGYYIPDRTEEGYGLNVRAIDSIKSQGISLIITVDCGISDREQIAHASCLGIDTIVLDHHEVADELPKAVALINPKQADCLFPFKHLAAVGIVFNFLIALRGCLREQGFWNGKNYPNLRTYLDIVALGTIADVVPLIDENRLFTRIGLELINTGGRTGIKALKEICALENQVIDTMRASFALIPRINAAGRLAGAGRAVELLLAPGIEEARSLAKELDTYNRKRQALEKSIFEEIAAKLTDIAEHKDLYALILASPDWHPGVMGIVASRLVDRFNRPAILISLKDGLGRGSGRSLNDFNIYQGLKKCDNHLLSYGGHCYAAGISIREEDIGDFAVKLNEIAKAHFDSRDLAPQTLIDSSCRLQDLEEDFLAQLDRLAPFGASNPEPVFLTRGVSISSKTVVGNKHLKMKIAGDGINCSSIWFNKGSFSQEIQGNRFDIVFTPQLNYWNGSADLQLKMKDMANLDPGT